jgi:hypothetical protein
MDMKQLTLEDFAAVSVRVAGVLVVIYALFSLIKSPALMERSVGEDRSLDIAGATFVIGGKTFVLSAKAGKIAVLLCYTIPAAVGVLLIWKSRFFARLICTGLA